MSAIQSGLHKAFSVLPSIPAPWMVVAMVVEFASDIQWYKRMTSLLWQTILGRGKEARCSLCDEVVNHILDFGDTKEALEDNGFCEDLCPFKFRRCVDMCEKLIKSITTSSKFPCEAIGACPELDEFGEEIQCKYQMGSGCTPSHMCKLKARLPMPRCELKDGYKQWKKYKMVLFENVGALAEAVKKLPKCGEEGASEVFCVNEATGFSLICEYLGYFLVFVVGSFNSIRAIETKGGDDDRQWLTFWVIYFIFSMVERFSSVLLSRLPVYYEVKLLLVIWLFPPFYGARWCYVTIHRTFSTLRNHWLIRYALSSMLVRFYGMSKEEVVIWLGQQKSETAIEYVLRSRQEVKDQLLVQSFVENALDKASKDDRFDSRVLSEFEGLKNAYPSYWGFSFAQVLSTASSSKFEAVVAPEIAATIEARQPVKSSQDKEAAEKYLEDLKRVIRVERSIGEALDLAHETVISRAKKMMESKIQELSLLPDSPCTEEFVLSQLEKEPDFNRYLVLQRRWRDLEVRFLEVELLDGKNFPRMDSTAFGGYADPYVKLTLRNEYPLDEGGVGRSGLLKALKNQFPQDEEERQQLLRDSCWTSRPVESATCWKARDPVWNQRMEITLVSGSVDYEGIWCNVAAPFHVLCVEVWDRDFPRFLNGERIASLEIPLARLMDGRSHMHCISFPWPESARHHSESNDDKGTISIKLQWIS
uniref:C2 domain-containing protein n=1 Tax=Guillardia theta TaxID=55529 RepID=A0A7S4UTK0_GUITH